MNEVWKKIEIAKKCCNSVIVLCDGRKTDEDNFISELKEKHWDFTAVILVDRKQISINVKQKYKS